MLLINSNVLNCLTRSTRRRDFIGILISFYFLWIFKYHHLYYVTKLALFNSSRATVVLNLFKLKIIVRNSK